MMETPFNEGPLSMRPLGFCDCDSPFYLIKGLIYYSCDVCKSGSPVGKCTICCEPVYLIRNKLHRTCNCGIATVGNITHTIDTITAILDPHALAKAIFPQIAIRPSTETLYLLESHGMDQPEESHSHAAQSETDGIEEDNITADIANRMYNHIMRESLDHIKTCTSCKFLAKQDEVCGTMRRLRKNRDRWLIEKITHEDVA